MRFAPVFSSLLLLSSCFNDGGSHEARALLERAHQAESEYMHAECVASARSDCREASEACGEAPATPAPFGDEQECVVDVIAAHREAAIPLIRCQLESLETLTRCLYSVSDCTPYDVEEIEQCHVEHYETFDRCEELSTPALEAATLACFSTMAPDPGRDPDPSAHPPEFPGLECWSLQQPHGEDIALIAIDPTSGAQRELARFDPGPDRSLMPGAGLAYVDGKLITALLTGSGFEIAEIDPTDAAFRSVETDFPAGATTYDGQLITVCDFFSNFCVYDTFEDLIDGRPRRQIQNTGNWSYLVNILGDEAYVADQAHQDITVIDVHSGAPLRPLTLEDYDDWTAGLSVVGDRLIALNTSDPGAVRVISFDRLTGSRLGEVIIGGDEADWSGLWCSVPGPTLPE